MTDFGSMLFVFVLATFIGLGVIRRVSRLLYTPLMSLTNAISAIAVVGSIVVTGADYPGGIRILGAIALFASMTNIVSGFLITDRMLKMFKKQLCISSESSPPSSRRPCSSLRCTG
jgi:NAD(P) transhydrogenase subunit alpha